MGLGSKAIRLAGAGVSGYKMGGPMGGMAAIAGSAARMGVKKLFKRGSSGKKGGTGMDTKFVSQYHEDKIDYKRRKAPRRVVKRARRSFRTWLKNYRSLMPPNNVIRQTNINVASASNTQGFFFAVLSPLAGGTAPSNANENPNDDLKQICALEILQDPIYQSSYTGNYGIRGTISVEDRNYMIRKQRMEVLISNAGSVPGWFEVYEWVLRKDICWDGGSTHTVGNVLVRTPSENITGGTSISAGSMMVDPFKMRDFVENAVIIKKHRHYLGNGSSFQFDVRGKSNYFLNGSRCFNASGQKVGLKGLTRGVYCQFYGDLSGTTPFQAQAISSVSVQIVREYEVEHIPNGYAMTQSI